MGLVPAAAWKIIFPAVFCLAKPAMEPGATAEIEGEMTTALPSTIYEDTKTAKARQCMNDITSGGNTVIIIGVITAPMNNTITAAQENTTYILRTTISVTVFGNNITTDRYSTVIKLPRRIIAGGDPTTNKGVPGSSSTAFEEATKRFLQNVTKAASIETLYTIYTIISDPVPNEDPTADTENATLFHEESFMSEDDVFPEENHGSTTPLSTKNLINTITGEIITQSHDNAIDPAENFGNSPKDLPDKTQGYRACYSGCDIIPPWATVLLCSAIAFFVFVLVGLLFLFPYYRKLRRPSAVSSSSSP